MTTRSEPSIHAWLAERGIASTAPLETIHERPWSTVVRVPTADDTLYLKQCAPAQAFEPALTGALAGRWRDRLPGVVAVDVERAWLLLRGGGTRLRELGSFEPYPRALTLYGELQVGETADADELLALRVPDLRLDVVAAAYEPFFAEAHGLTAEELEQLRALAPSFRRLCAELDAYGFPPSIQHNDLHDTNVYVRDGGIAILDWGDSCIAHPLCSWLVPNGIAQRYGLEVEPLRDAYLEPWTSFAPRDVLLDALRLALPIASFVWVLVLERHLVAMGREHAATYERYVTEQLRKQLEWLS